MTERTRAADDAAAISGRIAELRKAREALAQAGCDCPNGIDAHGTPIKTHVAGCPHFVDPGIGYFVPSPDRFPEDDWEQLRRELKW